MYKALIVKLTDSEQFRNSQTGEEMACRLFTLNGGGRTKTVRLYKQALPILKWVHPGAYPYYMHSFWNHHFPGDGLHLDRHHRIAEAAAMCWRAGWEVRPYALPGLQRERILPLVPEEPSLYLSRDIKRISDAELNKTSFTRMVGAAYCAGNCYAVYNTRKAAMKWNGMGEFKTVHSLAEISRLNAGIGNVDSAILFGASEGVALQSFSEKSKEQKKDLRPDVVFSHIHFVPLDENGVRQLQFFTIPDWKERLLSLLFDPETRSFNRSSFEYDAQVDGTFVLSHLDGDLARLIRFKEGIEGRTGPFEVLCFPHQVDFLREYLAGRAVIKTIEMDAVEAALGIEKRDAFE